MITEGTENGGGDKVSFRNEVDTGEWSKEGTDRCVERIREIVGHDTRLDGEDDFYRVADTLTDLRHYCDAELVNFHEAMDLSYQHYLAEKAGP